LQNKKVSAFIKYCRLLTQLAILLFWKNSGAQPIGNYVANGSFEEFYDCTSNSLLKAKQWMGIDSLCPSAGWLSVCNGKVPLNVGNYQYPRTGEAYAWSIFYYPYNFAADRAYPKNRLKATLQQGKNYCVKFYVDITNQSSYGMDGFGAFFGDNSIDTITHCTIPLTFITPQVQNPHGNIITDTLNWAAITGTFTANGTEKFLLLGNFLTNSAVDTVMINPTALPVIYTEVNIDDVSCIEVNLPAYAGRDTTIFLGDSTYIGRESDFAIDPGCMWYQLTNNTTAIDTISGIWVKPNATGSYTYVVRQLLDCSALKWDTVVVTVKLDDVGIKKYNLNDWPVEIYPNPAKDQVILKSTREQENLTVRIYDLTGRLVFLQQLKTQQFIGAVDLDLTSGAYMLTISNGKDQVLTKKLLIAK